VRTIDSSAARLAATEFGIVHRDLGRRYSDQFIADAMPTSSVVAGVDAPCKQLDAALDSLRKLQSTSVAELNRMLAGTGIPLWNPPAAPSCERSR